MKKNKIEIKLSINNLKKNNLQLKNNLNKIKKEEDFSSSSSESENNNNNSKNYIEKINEKIYLTQLKNDNLLNEEIIKNKDIFNYDKNYDKIQENKKIEINEKKLQLKNSNLVNKILKTVEIKNIEILKNKQKIESEKYFKEFGKKIPIFYTKNYKNKINELNNDNKNIINNIKENNFFDDFSKNKEIINNRKEEYSKNLYSNFQIENFNNLLKNNNKNTENNNNNNNLSKEEKLNLYKNNYLQRKKLRNDSNL